MLSVSFWLAFITVFVLMLKIGDVGAAVKAPAYRKVFRPERPSDARVPRRGAELPLDDLERAA